jgi:hypothetical protein
MGRRVFRTPQIPTTLPTLDEILGTRGIDGATAPEAYLGLLRSGLNVLTVHAEMEGLSMRDSFASLLSRCRDRGVRFLTLTKVAESLSGEELRICPVEMLPIFGRAGRVATQVLPESHRDGEQEKRDETSAAGERLSDDGKEV